MIDGTIPDCLAAQTVTSREQIGMTELEVAYAVSSPFGAGIETVGVYVFDSALSPTQFFYAVRLDCGFVFLALTVCWNWR